MPTAHIPLERHNRYLHNRRAQRARDSTSITTEHRITETSWSLNSVTTAPSAPSTSVKVSNNHRGNRNSSRGFIERNRTTKVRELSNSSDVSNIINPVLITQRNNTGHSKRYNRRRVLSTQGSYTHSSTNRQRQFKNPLTSENFGDTSLGNLDGDIVERVSSRPVKLKAKNQSSISSDECFAKSQASDVATRIHEDIQNSHYECLICTNEVLPSSKVWSCKTCWSVLHLSCVRHWAEKEISTYKQQTNESAEPLISRKWRCPGCNLPKDEILNTYTCWCAKEFDPYPIVGLPPHSCGQTCARSRDNGCPHPCESICHAGPCPSCSYMGPQLSCFCGKEKKVKKCIDTNYETRWTCKQTCEKWLACGKHRCQKTCHEGQCGNCEVLVESRCYCSKMIRQMPCSKLGDVRESWLDGKIWLGSFNCSNECKRIFDCGNPKHFCKKMCHQQDKLPAHCPFSPDMVNFCPCGKTPISELLNEPRKDCSVPIPNCTKVCRKALRCGHLCQMKCHSGDCGACQEVIQISCRCGRTNSDSLCHQGDGNTPHCPRICRSLLNCGRHECSNRCCPGGKKTSERLASKRKKRVLPNISGNIDNFEPEHICTRICGRPLKCGNHTCSTLCHKGPCPSCPEATFNEISCNCGQTTLQPPQPCGVVAPKCWFDCTRQPPCGHPNVKHQCHPNSESCPNCPFLVQKSCMCKKEILKSQPCWLSEVRCAHICGKKLKCGNHVCRKSCHREGQCEDSVDNCRQFCGRKKTVCDHNCMDLCHAPYPCKEKELCQVKILLTCACQNLKQSVKCLASKDSNGNSKNILACNDECLRLQRNARLAEALKINQATHQSDDIPYSTKTMDLFLNDPKFCQKYEGEIRAFASDEKLKILRLKPMLAHQRAFIQSLAKDLCLLTESRDAEPHRHVSILKTSRFDSVPTRTLNECTKVKDQKKFSEKKTSMSPKTSENWNAILLDAPRFGLTIDEIEADLGTELKSYGFKFEIFSLPCQSFLLRPIISKSDSEIVKKVLESKRISLTKLVSVLGLSADTTLCFVDNSLNVLRRADNKPHHQEWNQVVRRTNNSEKTISSGVGKPSDFIVLGSTNKLNKRENLKENIPEDWEQDVEN